MLYPNDLCNRSGSLELKNAQSRACFYPLCGFPKSPRAMCYKISETRLFLRNLASFVAFPR